MIAMLQARIRKRFRRSWKRTSTSGQSLFTSSRPQSQNIGGLPKRGHERSDTRFTLNDIEPLAPLDADDLMEQASPLLSRSPYAESSLSSIGDETEVLLTSRPFTFNDSPMPSPSLLRRPDSELIPDLTAELEDVVLYTHTNNTIFKARLSTSQQDVSSYSSSLFLFSSSLFIAQVAVKVSRHKGALSEDDLPTEKSVRLVREEEVVRACRNSSKIVPILGWAYVNGAWGLVSPWYENGNAKEFVKKHPTFNRRAIVLQVAEALHYLHTLPEPIVHADLKSVSKFIPTSEYL